MCWDLVEDFFNGDFDKTQAWFERDNAMLGGWAPRKMFVSDKLTNRLYKMIEQWTQLELKIDPS